MNTSFFKIFMVFSLLVIFQNVHAGSLSSFEKNVNSPPKFEQEVPPSRDSTSSDNCGLFCAILKILFWADEDDYYSSVSDHRDPSLYDQELKRVESSPKVFNDNLYAARTEESYHSSEEIAGTTFKTSYEIAGAIQAGEGDLLGSTIDIDAKLEGLYLKINISNYWESEESLHFNSFGVGFNLDLGKRFNMGLLVGLQTLEGQFYQSGFWASIAMDLKIKPWMWIVLDASNAQFKLNSVNDIQLGVRFFPDSKFFIEPYLQRKTLEISSDSLNFVGLKLGVLF